MRRLEAALRREGYDTLNIGYPSHRACVTDLGRLVADRIAAALAARAGDGPRAGATGPSTPIHFVGHSLGGILIRWLVAHQPPPRLGRIVLLGSPNCGSRLADFTRPWLRWLLRPIPDLTTDETNICH